MGRDEGVCRSARRARRHRREPLDERSNLLITRLRALLGIAYIGGAQVLGDPRQPGQRHRRRLHQEVLLIISTAVIDTAVLAMPAIDGCVPRGRRGAARLPGAIAGGVLFAGLQLFGVAIVGRAIAKASPVYGTFASVIGLLTWLSLHAVIALGGAELNAALVDRSPTATLLIASRPDSTRIRPGNLA